MPWAHADVLDKGLEAIKNGATKCILTVGYVNGDTYATVTGAAKKVAEVTITADDFVIANGANGARVLTFMGKSGASAPNAVKTTTQGQDLDFVFTNGVDKVLWATEETTDMAITTGNPVEFPVGLAYTKSQPTGV